jgi:phosphatidylserine/phosphatidylglycerophosphate/cardiolipin synthase-like enzyme
MHSKVLVVDEKMGIIGGRNHQNMYFDRDPKYNFKDRDILVIGSAVQDLVRSFREYWEYEYSVPGQYLTDVAKHLQEGTYPLAPKDIQTHPMFKEIDRQASDYDHIRQRFVEKAYRVEGQVEFFADAPGKPSKEKQHQGATWGTSSVGPLIKAANSSLIVQTPYLIFSESALSGLKKLRKEHPEMEFIGSTNSLAAADHYFTYAIAMKQKQRVLKDIGLQIFELKPVPGDVREMIPRYDQLKDERVATVDDSGERMAVTVKGPIVGIHAKSIVVDDHIALVGSHNFDPRSNTYDTQVVVVIWDKQVALALKANILRDTEPQNSWVVAATEQTPVVSPCLNCFGSCFSALPVFDIWPFSYSSSFELREGMEPVAADNPVFYELYEDVGQFPEVEDSGKAVQTRLFKAMGGFTKPLM